MSIDDALIGPWVCERANLEYKEGRFRAVGRIVDGKVVAGVLYEDFNGAQVVCHIAAEGNWANRHILWFIFDYPFNQLNASRMTATVVSSNVKSRKFVEQLGFCLECTLSRAHPDGDLLVYRMFKEDCRWLRNAHEIYKH